MKERGHTQTKRNSRAYLAIFKTYQTHTLMLPGGGSDGGVCITITVSPSSDVATTHSIQWIDIEEQKRGNENVDRTRATTTKNMLK